MHLVYTRDASGARRFYINGVQAASGTVVAGDFSSWGNYALALANEPAEDRPWLGELHLMALYDRALDAAEVGLNFGAGPDQGPPETVPPVVTAPADLSVTAVDASGTPATDPAIVAFLNAATAVDNVDGMLIPTNDAPAVFQFVEQGVQQRRETG